MRTDTEGNEPTVRISGGGDQGVSTKSYEVCGLKT